MSLKIYECDIHSQKHRLDTILIITARVFQCNHHSRKNYNIQSLEKSSGELQVKSGDRGSTREV